MKITRGQLRQIIKEEILQEIPEEIIMPSSGGGSVPTTRNEPGSAEIAKAVSEGDSRDKEIRVDMRAEAIKNFSALYVEEFFTMLGNFIEENPGIKKESDLSADKIKEIKNAAAASALKEYKRRYTNTVLIADYLARVERVTGKPIPPTFSQLVIRYAKDFAYQFIFGFIDNVILILAGAAIDDYIKVIFSADKLKRALSPDDLDFITDGVGNAISDGAGDLGGGAVEKGVDNWSWLANAATDGQLEIATPMQQLMAKTATFTGVVLGCLVAIPVGILVLKGLTAAGVTAAAGMGATTTKVTAGLAIVAAALIATTVYQEFKLLDRGAQDAIGNAFSRVMSAVFKAKRLRGDPVGSREGYTGEEFQQDLSDTEIFESCTRCLASRNGYCETCLNTGCWGKHCLESCRRVVKNIWAE